VLADLQRGRDNQVVVIGSSIEPVDHRICKGLKQAGCLVWRSYFANIEELYALADCYIFPTLSSKDSVELPLSVMEAMACNLPVLSTRFGALPRVFSEGDGMYFVDKIEDFAPMLDYVKKTTGKTKTREKVLPYSWTNVVTELEGIYKSILGEGRLATK
jgi:glycosyltransferase involved in cell wall biosynthesis